MDYSDKYGTFFGRLTDEGDVAVCHVSDGSAATRLDASVYPSGSSQSTRYEHPAGIVLSVADAARLGIVIEESTRQGALRRLRDGEKLC